MKNVLVAFSANNVAAREFVIGVFNYINEGHDWNVRMLGNPYNITPEIVREAEADGTDGILTGFNAVTPGYKALLESSIPLALNNYPSQLPPDGRKNLAILHNDEISCGRKAATFLRSKGNFRSFAYIPNEVKSWWNTYRQRGFRLELQKHGQQCFTFRGRRPELGPWLKKLVKPAAVFATNDMTGTLVLEACRATGIDVPGQIAVLGVDNDEIVCNGIRPTLSSLHPNHVELARRAAEDLDRIMSKRERSSAPIFVPPLGIIERMSTQKIPPAGFLIKSALAYISERATDGISARDVARHLNVSQSLLRLRFRTINGKSIRDEILDARFKAVNQLLETTQYSLDHIAAKTGFSSAAFLSHAYSKRFGIAPSKSRKPKSSPQNGKT